MDAAKEMLRIIARWSVRGKMSLGTEVAFLRKEDLAGLRHYARNVQAIGWWYQGVCNDGPYHKDLFSLIKSDGFFTRLAGSGEQWVTLEKSLSDLVGVLLQQSGKWLSSGRDIVALVEKMDLMEQLDCTIGDLTEEKLGELRNRSLSARDVETVGTLQAMIGQRLAEVMANKALVVKVSDAAESFSRSFRTSVSPALDRLHKAGLSQMCGVYYCHFCLSNVGRMLQGIMLDRGVDASASALNDLQVALLTYLKSTVSELSTLHYNLAVLFFVVRFKDVVDVWQTVDGLLQATKKALQ
ncbi:hypothetical protein [Pseudomonas sp. TE3610]